LILSWFSSRAPSYLSEFDKHFGALDVPSPYFILKNYCPARKIKFLIALVGLDVGFLFDVERRKEIFEN
jgi:hypothetical protein